MQAATPVTANTFMGLASLSMRFSQIRAEDFLVGGLRLHEQDVLPTGPCVRIPSNAHAGTLQPVLRILHFPSQAGRGSDDDTLPSLGIANASHLAEQAVATVVGQATSLAASDDEITGAMLTFGVAYLLLLHGMAAVTLRRWIGQARGRAASILGFAHAWLFGSNQTHQARVVEGATSGTLQVDRTDTVDWVLTLFQGFTVDQLTAELRTRRIHFPSRYLKHQLIQLVRSHGQCTTDQARRILAWRGRHRNVTDVTSQTAAADWLRAAETEGRDRMLGVPSER